MDGWGKQASGNAGSAGRTLPLHRRLAWWAALTSLLWLLYVAWQVLAILGAIDQLAKADEFVRTHGYNFQPAPNIHAFAFANLGAFFDQRATANAMLIVSLWGLVGAAGVAAMRANPFGWVGGRRVIWGGFALALMVGRFWAGWLTIFLGFIPAVLLVPLAPLLMIVCGCFSILTLFCIAATAFSVFIGIPVMFFNQLLEFENSLTVWRYQKTGLANYFIRFGYWLTGKAVPRQSDDSKGARWATGAEIVRLYDAKGMAFGHLNGKPLLLHTDKHVLIMASTRSGKGVVLIIPHLLRYRGSAFVLDPKGENAKATWRQRLLINGKVHALDPFGISGKPQSRFNPLRRFTPENMEAESKALAAALFIVGDRERDHWNAAGQQLLAAVILHVYAAPDIPADKKDLPTVRRLLLGGMDRTLQAMQQSDLADGLLSDLAASFLNTPEKEFGSILSTAQRQTEILDNPYIIACLSASGPGDEVDFAEWRRGSMTVYLCLSAPKFPVFNRWLRLVLTSALDEMTDTLRPPPLPVCFMLDELATLGHLQAVENAVGLAAGYGVQLVTVFQDVAQMRDLYKGRWASFIGNAGIRAVFNLDDFETAEYWSKFLGSRIAETHSRQEDIYGLSKGRNVGETVRSLMSPEELMLHLGSSLMLVLPQGARPILSTRVPYFDDGGLRGLWDDPRPIGARDPSPEVPPHEPWTSGGGRFGSWDDNSDSTSPDSHRAASQSRTAPAHASNAETPWDAPVLGIVSPAASAPASGHNGGDNKSGSASPGAGQHSEAGAPAAHTPFSWYVQPKVKPDRPPLDEAWEGCEIQRNALCPCGSGQKYKHCHGL